MTWSSDGSHNAAASDDGFNYLLFSDVHLGSDIVPHVRPWAERSWLRQEADVDAALVALLAHHRKERDPARPWRLVVAGDFLDLVGVSLSAAADLRTPPTEEELRCGLGSAADHVVHKVHAIAARHPRVFRALMEFVAEGHALVVVRGNHDVELHWRAAQRAFVDAIVAHAEVHERAAISRRIEICPWFFHVHGLLYVEHGQEFDPMCSYGNPLVPTWEKDQRRIRPTPFSVLLRQVARPTPGLSSSSYGYVGMGAYVWLCVRLGVRGTLRIAARYARACWDLISECAVRGLKGADRVRVSSRAKLARYDSLPSRMRRFAQRTGVSEERLRALLSVYVGSAVDSLSVMVRSLYVDRIASLFLTLLGLLVALLLYVLVGPTSAAVSAGLALASFVFACVGRGVNTSPNDSLRHGAERIAKLFNVRWVVMGHTHEPVMEPMSTGATYVNLGSWGQDDTPEERSMAHDCTQTFLTLRRLDNDYRADLLRWDPVRGVVEGFRRLSVSPP
ncbi:MAG: hypothetical protein QM778_31670 [Myxococcales bacterium]